MNTRSSKRKTQHPLYATWKGMLQRCLCTTNSGYHNYGGRGITVCDEWRNSFWRFVSDVGERPSKDYSLDRFPDKNGNYEPNNVRWATDSEQNCNRRDNHPLTALGKTQTMEEWSRETGIPKSTMFNRIRRGWPDNDVVAKPVQPKSADNTLFLSGQREECIRLGLNVFTIASRLRRGWSFSKAIAVTVAPQKGGNRHALQ